MLDSARQSRMEVRENEENFDPIKDPNKIQKQKSKYV